MKRTTDSKIWSDFKDGKEDALSFIYHQNIDFLFNYGKRFTPDEQVILDVIQDLFCYLIEKKQTLGNADNIRMYLLKSFRRKLFIEIDKMNKRTSTAETKYEPEIVFSIEDELIKDEEQLEKHREIQKGLQKLNSKQREALFYKYNSGFDYDQICEIMDVSYSSARQLVSRAVATLRAQMKANGFVFFLHLRKLNF